MNKKKKKIVIKNTKKQFNYKYVILIFIWTFILAAFLEYVTSTSLNNVSMFYGFIILFSIILIGIFFDIIGVAVTSADEVPFHAMSADKVVGAKESNYLIKHSDIVSNICNDVIGDVCGVISGGISAVIVAGFFSNGFSDNMVALSLVFTGLVSSLTVGGKSIGKYFAVTRSGNIVYFTGRIIYYFKKMIGRK